MLTGVRLTKGKAIAEYLGESRELKLDLRAAGQTVSDGELVVHTLESLPMEYATLVEVLELGEEELTLDVIQLKLMQRKQKLKLRAEARSVDRTSGKDGAVAYAAKHRGYSSSERAGEAQTSWEEARSVGARTEIALKKTEGVMSPETDGKGYSDRVRAAPRNFWDTAADKGWIRQGEEDSG
ncbi:hypothetical protein KFL_009180040 [Klebsormidium nitens]|uniref:Uncharacterized protein n=1 Tax=Klebsormidium nitens TaxID=105231 RepID=A0A1Y1IMH3_KLENI|nr:hypothetical protein KFL_009180040 [Klebsormidium nitens]|eukprot:GAQ92080.1 hypothetical protein KFL_009180040 [Klebsormidium nitens]